MIRINLTIFLAIFLILTGCGGSGNQTDELDSSVIIVNSLIDAATPTGGQVSLRSAVEMVADGGTISFDSSLEGQTIELNIVGEEHSVLKGEVMGFDYANNISYLIGYFERDYGKSALYARKDLTIDASALTKGITLAWTGDDSARVLAVYGNLTMNNVIITGGRSVAEEIADYDPEASPGSNNSQPWTLGRGGAVAVWGKATLINCTLHNNHCVGDIQESRDRGAFGGGLYADIVQLANSVVSGNTVAGAGAAGGGLYTVGGADNAGLISTIEQSSITGNRISGVFTYGGGVYSDGGGIGKLKTLAVKNSTIALNLVEPPFELYPSFLLPTMLNIGYWRGGGLYMSNGYLELQNCTVVENEVYGKPRTDSSFKPNLAGGIAATIGDAHAVENMTIQQSIIAGNQVHELDESGFPANSYSQDIFTGSLVHFYSDGYNLIDVINFDHMLAPIPQWLSLSRKHWPKVGDISNFDLTDILGPAESHTTILSQGVNQGEATVLWYPPEGAAIDQIPTEEYSVSHTLAEVEHFRYTQPDTISDFLTSILSTLAVNEPWATDIGTSMVDPGGIQWYGPSVTWPSNIENEDWIDFWHRLDNTIGTNMGVEKLGEAFWEDFTYTGAPSTVGFKTEQQIHTIHSNQIDQLGALRTTGPGDIGAIELSAAQSLSGMGN